MPKRLVRELRSLARDLPVHAASSVLLRFDADCPLFMRALITGPPRTPYEHGCFEFEVECPADYPAKPPRVRILTTKRGTLKFGPNLYADGKEVEVPSIKGGSPPRRFTRHCAGLGTPSKDKDALGEDFLGLCLVPHAFGRLPHLICLYTRPLVRVLRCATCALLSALQVLLCIVSTRNQRLLLALRALLP